MTAREVSPKEWRQALPHPATAYDSEAFISLNAHKVGGRVHHVLIDEGDKALGLIFGERDDGTWTAPFSAPFTSWNFRKRPSLGRVKGAWDALGAMGKKMSITLAPDIYNGGMTSLTSGIAANSGLSVVYDYNYHLPLEGDPVTRLQPSARNKYNHACKGALRLVMLDSASEDDVARAYAVIADNRREHGYPLRMSLDDVLVTIRIIPSAFAVVSDKDGNDVAAAQVFFPVDGVGEVIYWGDRGAYSSLRPMNFLAVELCRALAERCRILDLGPASTDGVPNEGLCDFKASLGAVPSLKPSVMLNA